MSCRKLTAGVTLLLFRFVHLYCTFFMHCILGLHIFHLMTKLYIYFLYFCD